MKKTIIIACLCTIISLCFGVSGAYLTQKTETKDNVITIGKINATLSEPKWDELTPEDKILVPEKSVTKDPTVTNLNNSTNSCYAFLQISIPKKTVKLYEYLDDGTSIISNEGIPVETDLFKYKTNENWVLIESNQTNEESIYVYGYSDPIAPGESTLPLFDEIVFNNVVEGEIPIHTNLTIPIVMISIQSDYLPNVTNVSDAWNVYKEVNQ